MTGWQGDKVRWENVVVRLGELRPWGRNPRRIGKAEAKRLGESWDEFGQVELIAIGPENEVYNGHQRLTVLMERFGGEYEVEARRASRGLSEKERERLTVLLHSGATGAWIEEALATWDMEELKEWGLDAATIGGAQEARAQLRRGAMVDPGAEVDRAEELRAKWGVEVGQVWRLGEHRVVCGDCTDRGVVDVLMAGEVGDLLLTDPPYNVGIEYGAGTNDRKTVEENEAFIRRWFGMYEAVKLKVVTPGAGYYLGTLRSWLTLFPPRWMCIWVRRNSMSHSPLRGFQAWEPVLFYGEEEEDADSEWGGALVYGKVRKSVKQDVFTIPVGVQKDVADVDGKKLHPTPKPLELFDVLLRAFGEAGDLVVDPFLGSGTTLVACERLGRRCRGVEIEPGYVAVGLERWAKMTGGRPEVVGTDTDAGRVRPGHGRDGGRDEG